MRLENKVLAFSRSWDMFSHDASVLCALSGGADSITLLCALLELKDALGLKTVAAAHFNHRLRGAEADADEAFVRALCDGWGVSLFTGRADVAAEVQRRGAGLEETARAIRYDFLFDAAEQAGFSHIATGHTADDNVETVLLHLVRGAGLHGLTGIPPVRGNIVRPMLTCTRAEVEAFLSDRGLSHVEDSTNRDTALARNRLRRNVIPELLTLNPQLADTVGGLTARLRFDEEYLQAQAEKEMASLLSTKEGATVSAERLDRLPRALSSRLCRLLYAEATETAETAGPTAAVLNAAHVEAVLSMCGGARPSAKLDLPGGLVARREYDKLVIGSPVPAAPPFAPAPLTAGAICRLPAIGSQLTMDFCPLAGRSGRYHFFLAPEQIRDSLTVRARKTGDRIRLPGKPGGKSLKRLMIDAKIPAFQRDSWPVIADGPTVVAVPGLGVNVSYMAAVGARAMEISFMSL